MTRTDFSDSSFENCDFVSVNLAGSEFYNCQFKKTRFLKSNLNSLGVQNAKVWRSDDWVEIDQFSSFEQHLDLDEQ